MFWDLPSTNNKSFFVRASGQCISPAREASAWVQRVRPVHQFSASGQCISPACQTSALVHCFSPQRKASALVHPLSPPRQHSTWGQCYWQYSSKASWNTWRISWENLTEISCQYLDNVLEKSSGNILAIFYGSLWDYPFEYPGKALDISGEAPRNLMAKTWESSWQHSSNSLTIYLAISAGTTTVGTLHGENV